MTSKQKNRLKQITLSAEDLRALCWDYRRDKEMQTWFALSKCGVQDLQLKRFLDDGKGITTDTMSKLSKYLIENW